MNDDRARVVHMYAKHIHHTENLVLRVRNVINPSDRLFDEKYRVNEGLKISSITRRLSIFLLVQTYY